MENWNKVFESATPVRAEIVKGVLVEYGINAIIMNKKDSVYQIHGQYEVLVPIKESLTAINIITNEITF
jgi:hypothetical protein